MSTPTQVKDSFKLLLIASGITLLLWFVPYAGVLTYPVRLFVTFIHEAGHAIAALATSGTVNSIALDWNESGLTYTRGGWRLFISSAGYLSTIAYGASLLLLLRSARFARLAAAGTGVFVLLITVLFGGNLLVWLVGLLFGAGLVFLGVKGRIGVTHFLMSFLAVQCLLNAFYHLRALLYLSAFDPSIPTDAGNMSEATGGIIPPIVWALGWSVLSVLAVGMTLVVYYRSLRRKSESIDPYTPLALPPLPRSSEGRVLSSK
ncbi:MAG TPA: M50 family metallopeptidase [Blastocatellia bacterium]|nr:M50 family metallopeptidase [Blastocatellia bacterium]